MGTFTAPALLQRLTLLQRNGHFFSASTFTALDTLTASWALLQRQHFYSAWHSYSAMGTFIAPSLLHVAWHSYSVMGTFTAPALLQRLTLLQRHVHFYNAGTFPALDTLTASWALLERQRFYSAWHSYSVMGAFTAPAYLQRLSLLQRHGHFYSASTFAALDTRLTASWALLQRKHFDSAWHSYSVMGTFTAPTLLQRLTLLQRHRELLQRKHFDSAWHSYSVMGTFTAPTLLQRLKL